MSKRVTVASERGDNTKRALIVDAIEQIRQMWMHIYTLENAARETRTLSEKRDKAMMVLERRVGALERQWHGTIEVMQFSETRLNALEELTRTLARSQQSQMPPEVFLEDGELVNQEIQDDHNGQIGPFAYDNGWSAGNAVGHNEQNKRIEALQAEIEQLKARPEPTTEDAYGISTAYRAGFEDGAESALNTPTETECYHLSETEWHILQRLVSWLGYDEAQVTGESRCYLGELQRMVADIGETWKGKTQ